MNPRHRRIVNFSIILAVGSLLIYSFWNDMNQDWLSDSQIILEWGWFGVGVTSIIVSIVAIVIFCKPINKIDLIANISSVLLVIGAICVVYGRWYESDRWFYIIPKFDDWEYFGLAVLVFLQCAFVVVNLTSK